MEKGLSNTSCYVFNGNYKHNYSAKTLEVYNGNIGEQQEKSRRHILYTAFMGDKMLDALLKSQTQVKESSNTEIAEIMAPILQPLLCGVLFAISPDKYEKNKPLSVNGARFLINCVLVVLGCFNKLNLEQQDYANAIEICTLLFKNLFKITDNDQQRYNILNRKSSGEYFSDSMIDNVYQNMKEQFEVSLFPQGNLDKMDKLSELVSQNPFITIRFHAEFDMCLGGHLINVVNRFDETKCNVYFSHILLGMGITNTSDQNCILDRMKRFLAFHDIGKLDGYFFRALNHIENNNIDGYHKITQEIFSRITNDIMILESEKNPRNTEKLLELKKWLQLLDKFGLLCISYSNTPLKQMVFYEQCNKILMENKNDFIGINKYGIEKSKQVEYTIDVIKTFKLFEPGDEHICNLISNMLMFCLENDIMADAWMQRCTIEEAARKFKNKIIIITNGPTDSKVTNLLLDLAIMYHFCDAGSYKCVSNNYYGFNKSFEQYMKTTAIVNLKKAVNTL